jgi:uncharacterized protein (TIGR02001 family)
MRTFIIGATALATALVAAPAMADDAPAAAPAPTPDFTITGSAGVWSQYRFRGISQSDNKPVLQGSLTLTHKSGFYLSTWGSSASAGNSTVNIGGTEIDVFGGWSHTYKGGLTIDGGLYGYLYPGEKHANPLYNYLYGPMPSINYYEVYGDVSKVWGPITAKLGVNWAPNQAVFDYTNTHYSVYEYGELSYAFPKFPLTIHSHLGHTGGGFDYTKQYIDYTVGATYKWKALSFDVSFVGTNVSHHDAEVNPLYDQEGFLSPHQTYRAAKGVVVGSISASF